MLETARFLYQLLPEFWLAIVGVFFCLGLFYAHATWRVYRRHLQAASRERSMLLRERSRAIADRAGKIEASETAPAIVEQQSTEVRGVSHPANGHPMVGNAPHQQSAVAIAIFDGDKQPMASPQLSEPQVAPTTNAEKRGRGSEKSARIHPITQRRQAKPRQSSGSTESQLNIANTARIQNEVTIHKPSSLEMPKYASSGDVATNALEPAGAKQDPKYFSNRYASSD